MILEGLGDKVIEVQGTKFVFGPLKYKDFLVAVAALREGGIQDDTTSLQAFAHVSLISRLKSWDVVLPDGSPAPCTMENKMILFGRNPGLLSEISGKLIEAEVEEGKEQKNSGSMQDGSSSETRKPATPAGSLP